MKTKNSSCHARSAFSFAMCHYEARAGRENWMNGIEIKFFKSRSKFELNSATMLSCNFPFESSSSASNNGREKNMEIHQGRVRKSIGQRLEVGSIWYFLYVFAWSYEKKMKIKFNESCERGERKRPKLILKYIFQFTNPVEIWKLRSSSSYCWWYSNANVERRKFVHIFLQHCWVPCGSFTQAICCGISLLNSSRLELPQVLAFF